jgi:hypothetical protein
MARIKPPFTTSKKGIAVNLGSSERDLLRTLVGEVRELLTTSLVGDPKLARLFPPAYFDNDEAETEYQRLMRDELIASRLHSIATVDAFLSDDKLKIVTFAQLDAFCAALNGVRLVLGTVLNIDEIDDYLDADHPRHDELTLYNYLSWLLDGAVSTLMEQPLP